MPTALDNFRTFYTFNWAGESDSLGEPVTADSDTAKKWNLMKILMCFPVIGQITAAVYLTLGCKKFKQLQLDTKTKICFISRGVIGLTGVLNPGLFLVDAIGTPIKFYLDKRVKKINTN